MSHVHHQPELNFIVDGLSATVTQSDMIALFSSCGRVKAVEMVLDADGLPLGIARVTMATKEEAGVARHAFHRCRFRDRTLLLFEETTMNRKEDSWNRRLSQQP